MPEPITVQSIHDGPKIEVSYLLKNPKELMRPIVDYMNQWDMAAMLFRDAGPNEGSVLFESQNADFTEDGLVDVAEFGEIPATRPTGGAPKMALAHKLGRALEISYEMRDFNRMERVQRNITQLTNSALRSQARKFIQVAQDPAVPAFAASKTWEQDDAKILNDIAAAMKKIGSYRPEGVADEEELSMGYAAKYLVVSEAHMGAISLTKQVQDVYTGGNIADKNPAYAGWTGLKLNGLEIITPKFFPSNKALVLSEEGIGFYSDARELNIRGPFDFPDREFIRFQVTQMRAMGLDNPGAGCWINGIA